MIVNATRRFGTSLALLLAVAAPGSAFGQDAKPKRGYTDTPMLPGLPYRVHDGTRPLPRVVTPGTSSTPEQPGQPPSDAVVLFDGSSTDAWHDGKGQPIGWTVENGALVVKGGTGAIVSREEFGDVQLHLEWAEPTPPSGSDQGRGNSGVLLFGRYEIQVLDSYQNETYADGQAGAIYGQYPPLVNACRPPGEWQSYDILFTAPRFKADGSLESPAYFTILQNGVLIQNHRAAIGPMAFRNTVPYQPHGPRGPLVLQDHGNPVRFRNIWVRKLDEVSGAESHQATSK
jgi:hypothetical protein